MNKPIIEWGPVDRLENRDRITDVLEYWSWLLPSWVRVICCNVADGDQRGHLAEVFTDKDYCRISIEFKANLLDRPDDVFEKAILHELLHTFNNPMYLLARDHFQRILSDPQQRDHCTLIVERLCMENESSTEEMTHILYEKFGRG